MKAKLAHVCIESADLEETERYYASLGLHRQFDFRNQAGDLVGYYLGFSDLTFLEVIKVRETKPPGLVRHFAIQVDDVEQARRRLLDNGFSAGDKEMGGDDAWMVTTHDPNGVFIELHEYTDRSMQLVGGTCPGRLRTVKPPGGFCS